MKNAAILTAQRTEILRDVILMVEILAAHQTELAVTLIATASAKHAPTSD